MSANRHPPPRDPSGSARTCAFSIAPIQMSEALMLPTRGPLRRSWASCGYLLGVGQATRCGRSWLSAAC
eukprot:3638602-Alexandrium_andersonii.AAC.1